MRRKIPLWLLTLPLNVMLGVGLVAASSMAQLGAGAQSWTLSAAELPPVGGQFCAQSRS